MLEIVNMTKPLKLNSLKRWLAHCLRLQLVIDWRADNGKIGEKIPLFQIQATTKILSSRWPRALHVFSKNISQYVARLMSFFLQFGRNHDISHNNKVVVAFHFPAILLLLYFFGGFMQMAGTRKL